MMIKSRAPYTRIPLTTVAGALFFTLALTAGACGIDGDTKVAVDDAGQRDGSSKPPPPPNPDGSSSPDASDDAQVGTDATVVDAPVDAPDLRPLCSGTDGGVSVGVATNVADTFFNIVFDDCRVGLLFNDDPSRGDSIDLEGFVSQLAAWIPAYLECTDGGADAGANRFALIPPETAARLSAADFDQIVLHFGEALRQSARFSPEGVTRVQDRLRQQFRGTAVRSDAGGFSTSSCPADGGTGG